MIAGLTESLPQFIKPLYVIVCYLELLKIYICISTNKYCKMFCFSKLVVACLISGCLDKGIPSHLVIGRNMFCFKIRNSGSKMKSGNNGVLFLKSFQDLNI